MWIIFKCERSEHYKIFSVYQIFLQETVIPADKTQVTAFSVIDNQLNEQLRILANEPIKDDENSAFQSVKKLYKACFNTDLIEQRGTTPVTTVLNAMGGWPIVMTNWNQDSSWTWQKSVEWSRQNGFSVSYFLSFSVSTDNKDTTKRIIKVLEMALESYLRFHNIIFTDRSS